MAISIEHHDKQFNVLLSQKEGGEPYLTIKGCRIAQGPNGPFVSWPSNKNEKTGKWWNHVWATDAFNSAVMAAYDASKPKAKQSSGGASDDDIPFAQHERRMIV
jgi:DNA-binding cell septation regulator SpoVG